VIWYKELYIKGHCLFLFMVQRALYKRSLLVFVYGTKIEMPVKNQLQGMLAVF
jgi:hypothetical protein